MKSGKMHLENGITFQRRKRQEIKVVNFIKVIWNILLTIKGVCNKHRSLLKWKSKVQNKIIIITVGIYNKNRSKTLLIFLRSHFYIMNDNWWPTKKTRHTKIKSQIVSTITR